MVRDVLLARGGASGAASGLGRAHHDLVKVLDSNNIEGYAVGGVIEHELGGIQLNASIDVGAVIQSAFKTPWR